MYWCSNYKNLKWLRWAKHWSHPLHTASLPYSRQLLLLHGQRFYQFNVFSLFNPYLVQIFSRFNVKILLEPQPRSSSRSASQREGHYEEKCYWKFIFGKIKYLHRNWSHRRRDHFSTSIKNLDRNLFSWSMTTFTY